MAQKAPKAPGNRRTTYQGAGARSTGRGSVVTTQCGGSVATINPGAQRRRKAPAKPRAMSASRRVAQENRQTTEERKAQRAREQERAEARQRFRAGARAPGQAAAAVTQRSSYGAKHMLTAELIIGVLIVAMRAVADYEPQADGTIKGKIGHPKGQYGPLPILAGLIVTFFLLSFLAASGGTKAKLAVIFGGTIDIALLLKSTSELKTVSDVFGTFGKAKMPPGSWQTTGTEAGLPISGTLPAGAGTPPNLNPKGNKKNPSAQPPPGAIPVPKGGCPSGFIEEGDPKTGAKWCAPTMG